MLYISDQFCEIQQFDIYIETKQQEQITAYQSGVIQIPNTEI